MSQTAQLDLELKGYMEARFGKVGIDLMEATHERFQKPKAFKPVFCWLATLGCSMRQCEVGAVMISRGLHSKALGELFDLSPNAVKSILSQMSRALSLAGKVKVENLEGLSFREKIFFRWAEYLSEIHFAEDPAEGSLEDLEHEIARTFRQ